MFKPDDETAKRTPNPEAEKHHTRRQAMAHAVELACANAAYRQGVTAEHLVGYADKIFQYLHDGTVPPPEPKKSEKGSAT